MAIEPEGMQPSQPVPPDAVAPSPAPAAVRKAPRDPVVDLLGVTILLVVVLALVTGVFALVTGVFGTGAPRTAAENRIMTANARIQEGSTERGDWVQYINALIADGQYGLAQQWIDKGKKTLAKQEVTQDMVYMQATLYAAQGKPDQALAAADAALKTIKKTQEKAAAASAKSGNPTEAGLLAENMNYWDLLLLKAEIHAEKAQWKQALAAYDQYLAGKPTAATVLVLRGTVRARLKDDKGAKADFQRALVFIPDNAEALAGLKRIGVAK